MDKVDLFVTTWNMGGINREDIVGDSLFNRLLPKWIPVPASGYDLYVCIPLTLCVLVSSLPTRNS